MARDVRERPATRRGTPAVGTEVERMIGLAGVKARVQDLIANLKYLFKALKAYATGEPPSTDPEQHLRARLDH